MKTSSYHENSVASALWKRNSFLPSENFINATYLRKMGHEVVTVELDQSDLDFSQYEVVVVWCVFCILFIGL